MYLVFKVKKMSFTKTNLTELGRDLCSNSRWIKGTKGFVTDVIQHEELSFDTLYSCGPTPMLQALSTLYPDRRVFLSLEERMGCGIGACFACVCHVVGDETGTSYRKVCTDGPVFPVGEVVL